MEYDVLSPWGYVDASDAASLNPRPKSLDNIKIGMFAHFKEHAVVLLEEVAAALQAKLPTASFHYIQYKKETSEIQNDPEFYAAFKMWLSNVDIVISAYGDMGSCALFQAYNTALVEKLGKPAIMLTDYDFVNSCRQGASARLVPSLRLVETPMHDLSLVPALNEEVRRDIVRPAVEHCMDALIRALTSPLTDSEREVPVWDNTLATAAFSGTLTEINDLFYKHGWTNGAPIIPPTRQRVAEMLQGTDLPKDQLIGRIPPMLGAATVEKIAVNAVMAGCSPLHLPVLIAAVEGMLDPRIKLEGWTCSRASWAPMLIINGPIRHDLDMNTGSAIFSPYRKSSAVIAKAFGMIIMNIGGVRPAIEDLSGLGHEARFGFCIAENEEESPWPPLQTDFGLTAEDSAVTLFWPSEKYTFRADSAEAVLRTMCARDDGGFDPGCCYVLCPEIAETLHNAGLSKAQVLDYVYEYARKPSEEVPLRWLIGNNHLPELVSLPLGSGFSTRRYWSKDHLLLLVGGAGLGAGLMGGGDHGGPVCKKIRLPKNWKTLAETYEQHPEYICYNVQ